MEIILIKGDMFELIYRDPYFERGDGFLKSDRQILSLINVFIDNYQCLHVTTDVWFHSSF